MLGQPQSCSPLLYRPQLLVPLCGRYWADVSISGEPVDGSPVEVIARSVCADDGETGAQALLPDEPQKERSVRHAVEHSMEHLMERSVKHPVEHSMEHLVNRSRELSMEPSVSQHAERQPKDLPVEDAADHYAEHPPEDSTQDLEALHNALKSPVNDIYLAAQKEADLTRGKELLLSNNGGDGGTLNELMRVRTCLHICLRACTVMAVIVIAYIVIAWQCWPDSAEAHSYALYGCDVYRHGLYSWPMKPHMFS